MEAVRIESFPWGCTAVFSSRKPNKPTPNEDSMAILPWHAAAGILMVADGVGGLPAGHEASAHAIRALRDSLALAQRSKAHLHDALCEAVEAADQRVSDSHTGGATTLAIATIEHAVLRSYHAGDSVVLVTDAEGDTKFETIAHSPVGKAVAMGEMDRETAMFHPARALVSNAVGSPGMWLETGTPVPLAPLDSVLLASDGVTDNVYLDEIGRYLRIRDIGDAARELLRTCRQRMATHNANEPCKPDDLSFILFRLIDLNNNYFD